MNYPPNIMKIVRDLEERLMREYGNVLREPFTQSEVHDTYYVSNVLELNGHVHDDNYKWDNSAINAAFVAGRRVERNEQEKRQSEEMSNAMSDFLEIKNIVKGWV